MFGELTIVGALVSLLTQWIKKKFGTEGLKTSGIVILFSIIGGAAYWVLEGTSIWANFLEILAVASTIYAFIFNLLPAKK